MGFYAFFPQYYLTEDYPTTQEASYLMSASIKHVYVRPTWPELFIQYSFHSLFQNMNRAGSVTGLGIVRLQWIQMRGYNAKTGPNIYKPGDGRAFSLNLSSIWFVFILIKGADRFYARFHINIFIIPDERRGSKLVSYGTFVFTPQGVNTYL